MPARKRGIEEVDAPDSPSDHGAADNPLLSKIQNMWEFACLMQYIYLFGEVVKINKTVDIDTLELECCKPTPSDLLPQIGLALLKFVSSHRGLTPELFDEYTRRQYDSKAPGKPNPFGYDEEPRKFDDFDIVLKLRVLHQLSVWTLNNPDRIRQALADDDMTNWRIEPFGWDRQDRTYYILDDNRLYRMTQPVVETPKKAAPKPKKQPPPPPPPPPPKPKGSRSSKRQRLANGLGPDSDVDVEPVETVTPAAPPSPPSPAVETQETDNSLGGAKWECVAISFQEYKNFTDSIKKSKDPNEKELHQRLIEDIFPVLEKLAADHERKAAQKRREWENLQRLATAKRSSRIADKQEKQKEQREAEEVERKKQEELSMAMKEQERLRKIEEERESRMITREQRLREREMRRILSEQQLAELESQSQTGAENSDSRVSERHRQNEVDRKRKELEEIGKADEEWYFDCSICGVHGKNLDDGSHIIACEKCDVWQHSACHGIKEEDADREDFQFLCSSCQNPRSLKLHVSSPTAPQDETKKQTPKSNRGRKRKSENQAAATGELKKKKKRDPNAPPTERKKVGRPRKVQDQPAPHINGTGLPPNGPPGLSDSTTPSNSNAPVASNLYRPAQGHFLPPTNGQTSRPSDHMFYHYHPGNYSPNQASNGQAVYSAPSPSSPPSQSNAFRLNNSSNIAWQHQTQPSMHVPYGSDHPHQPGQTPHNPFFNDFSRQRITPQANESHGSHGPYLPKSQSSPSHTSPPSSSFATSRPPPHVDRHENPPQYNLPAISASPTPSFSATQGNTGVRFSPTQGPASGNSTFSPGPNHLAHSYVPTNNNPTGSAISPMKPSSSPPLPAPTQAQVQVPDGRPGVPKFHSPPQSSTAGISPVKYDAPPAAAATTSNPYANPGLGITSPNTNIMTPTPAQPTRLDKPREQLNPQPSKGPSSMQHILNDTDSIPAPAARQTYLPPAPTLSPSFGVNKGVEPLPKKVDDSPPLPPVDSTAANHTLPPDVSGPSASPNPMTDNVNLPPLVSTEKPSPEPTKSPSNPPLHLPNGAEVSETHAGGAPVPATPAAINVTEHIQNRPGE